MRSGGDGDDDRQRPCDGDDDEGTRQPYKCAFCRRGFPTAQALGGHMNVHRKDRPATKAAPRGAGVCGQESPAVIDALLAYGVLVHHPEASGAAGGSSRIRAQRPPQELRLFGHVDDAGRGKEDQGGRGARDRGGCYDARDDGGDHGEQEEEEDEELDLELRLGAAGQ